jgi:uncharacterized membrane protein YdbT with pleckstrin-like domain
LETVSLKEGYAVVVVVVVVIVVVVVVAAIVVLVFSPCVMCQFWQEPEPSQASSMALARCILGKFLGVVCH